MLRQNAEAPGCGGRAREKVDGVPSPERGPDVPSPARWGVGEECVFLGGLESRLSQKRGGMFRGASPVPGKGS